VAPKLALAGSASTGGGVVPEAVRVAVVPAVRRADRLRRSAQPGVSPLILPCEGLGVLQSARMINQHGRGARLAEMQPPRRRGRGRPAIGSRCFIRLSRIKSASVGQFIGGLNAMQTRFLNRLTLVSAILGFMFLGLGTLNEIQAAVITVPNQFVAQEGNSNNAVPFTFSSRYQQVYANSAFSSIVGPELITEILFRPDAQFGAAFSATIPNIIISLSTTQFAPDGLSPVFANNIGPDNTVAYSGPLTLSSMFTGPSGGPKNFDIAITLQSPFIYNPTQGNLLLDVKDFTNNFFVIPVFDAEDVVGDSISRIWNDIDVNADVGFFGNGNPNDFANSLGLVTQFVFSSIPEPSSLALLGIALLYSILVRIFARPM
jgi:hypothetical protein